MTILIADCPRCNADRVTFDVKASTYRGKQYNWQVLHEVFGVCRHCLTSTIFRIKLSEHNDYTIRQFENYPDKLLDYKESLNTFFRVDGFISTKDQGTRAAPDHLPEDLKKAFDEGAVCLSIGCFNASACMFRLCLDIVSRPLIPALGSPGPKAAKVVGKKEVYQLGARLDWLFANEILPPSLSDLADCVRNDGNDGAHAGTLSETDAEDIYDFTFALLERLITEPEKIRLAQERRAIRRASN